MTVEGIRLTEEQVEGIRVTVEGIRVTEEQVIFWGESEEVGAEFLHACKLKSEGKFKETAYDMARDHRMYRVIGILVEEVGEVARGVNDRNPVREIRQELIQVAAIALAAVKGLDHATVMRQNKVFS